MERMRTTLLLLLVLGLTSMMAVAAVTPGAAVPGTATTAPALTAAGETSCSSCLKCPCGCSPLAGAWVAKLLCDPAWPTETMIQTFKFAPINEGCTKFVVNSQSVSRLTKVAKFWPNACDQTEFVGIACKDEWGIMKFTAISYGVDRCISVQKAGAVAAAGTTGDATTCVPCTDFSKCPVTRDKVVFIAIMSGKVEIPDSCLTCDSKSYDKDGKYTGECKEPKELKVTLFISFFDAAQDLDRDGFPDCDCKEAVLCIKCETCLKRVELMEPCDAETKSFIACLSACKDVMTAATGRAFIKLDPAEQDVDVVLTVSGLKDVKKAVLQIGGVDALLLFPCPPDKAKDGDCEGLLVCKEFPIKDFIGPLKGKKLEDLEMAIQEGKATVVVSTAKFPKGEICGTVEDP